MLKIYGIPRSRAFRTLWMAKELGLEYENIPVDMAKGETRSHDYLQVNPNGHIPAIDDDGVILWESMAINLYLAKKHARGSLYPILFEDEARTWQWSFWGMTEIERPVLTAMFHRALLPEDKRDAALADQCEKELGRPLMVLDSVVAATPYLLGEHFTVADLNLASILSWARPARIDLSHVPKMADWLKRCAERPAAREARALQRGRMPGMPQTIVYVSNAGDPSIGVLAMDRASGNLEPLDKVAIPGVTAGPTSMPLAVSPDRRFLHAALRSEPFTAASFAINPASGRLSHLGNAPLDASMAYISVDKTGKWLLCASYPQGKLTINPILADGRVAAPPRQVVTDRPRAHCVVVDASNRHVYVLLSPATATGMGPI